MTLGGTRSRSLIAGLSGLAILGAACGALPDEIDAGGAPSDSVASETALAVTTTAPAILAATESGVSQDPCRLLEQYFLEFDSTRIETPEETLAYLVEVSPDLESELVELAEYGFTQPRFSHDASLAEQIDDETFYECEIPLISSLDTLRLAEGVRPSAIPCFVDTYRSRFFEIDQATGEGILEAAASPYLPADCDDSAVLELSDSGEWVPSPDSEEDWYGTGPTVDGAVATPIYKEPGFEPYVESTTTTTAPPPVEVLATIPIRSDTRPDTFLPDTFPGDLEMFQSDPQFDLLGYLIDGAPPVSEIWKATLAYDGMTTHLYAKVENDIDLFEIMDLVDEQLTPVFVQFEDEKGSYPRFIYVDEELGWAIGFDDNGIHFQAIGTKGYPLALAFVGGL